MEKTNWNLREALESFMELLEENKIPPDAFNAQL